MRFMLMTALALSWVGMGCKSEPKVPAAAAPAVAQKVEAQEPKPAQPAGDAAAAAMEVFSSRCTPCHGPKGAGDGPASAGLTPKPASFASAEWQAKVTDEHIEKLILYGGSAVGKSAAMPPNPDLEAKPEVIKALRSYIRSLKP